MLDRHVLITGLGMVSPLGSDRETTWARLLAGDSALRWLNESELATSSAHWPAQPAGAPAALISAAFPETCESEALRRCIELEPVLSLAVTAAAEAIRDAQLDLIAADLDRIGCVIGTSKGGIRTAERLVAGQAKEITPASLWPLMWPSGAAATVAAVWNLQGPLLSPVTACATGLSCLVRAVELIQDDVCDVVIAGSADASLTPAMLATFKRLGVLARIADNPAQAVRPFDRQRSGFLIGEGAAMFVLESERHARSRRQSAYARWLSGSGLSDATGLTQLSAEPTSLVRLIHDNLQRAELATTEIGYVNLHGTATEMNDLVEASALVAAFGSHASRLPASSLKGAIGHLLGAAGSVEFAATLLALRDQRLPPNLNLIEPASGFDLDFVRETGRTCSIETALKLSLGFGGHLVAAIVGRDL